MKILPVISLCFALCFSACVEKNSHIRSSSSNTVTSSPPTALSTPTSLSLEDRKDATLEIQKIVAKHFELNLNEVGVNTPLSKLKKPADELDVVEIIMTVEETFNIEIKDDELGGSDVNAVTNITVKQLADLVVNRKKAK